MTEQFGANKFWSYTSHAVSTIVALPEAAQNWELQTPKLYKCILRTNFSCLPIGNKYVSNIPKHSTNITTLHSGKCLNLQL